jgi:hypothetical protein
LLLRPKLCGDRGVDVRVELALLGDERHLGFEGVGG